MHHIIKQLVQLCVLDLHITFLDVSPFSTLASRLLVPSLCSRCCGNRSFSFLRLSVLFFSRVDTCSRKGVF